MDPIIVILAVKYAQSAKNLYDHTKKAQEQHQRELREQEILDNVRDISSRVNEILAYHEQDILREIKSAYDAIITAEITENSETRALRLNYAENQLLKNTELNRSLSMADHPNTYWVALSNFGLAIVCILREDPDTAFTHLLKTFEADPHFARCELAPTTYELLFAETINGKLQETYTSKINEIEKRDCFWDVFGRKCWAGTITGGGFVAGIALGLLGEKGLGMGIFHQAQREAEKAWNEATSESIINEKKEGFKLEFNKNKQMLIDNHCRELAKKFLDEKLPLQSIQDVVEAHTA